jgi:ubiquinone/menaquinone biosynthesis C-methylase UbiE
MSKWGIEEKETIEVINKIGLSGNILDVAAGDGRFINELLNLSQSVTAIDINKEELDSLINNCPKELLSKLNTEIVDITKTFPYEDNSFDGVFCTGTLHLFNKDVVSFIINEIKRCLKSNGKIVLDFATDIKRYDKDGNEVVFEGEGCYTSKEAVILFRELLNEFSFSINEYTFSEDNLSDAGYSSIKGNFLIISGFKK